MIVGLVSFNGGETTFRKDGNDFQCDEKRSEMFQWKEGDTVSWMIQRACCKLYFLQYVCMYEYVSILLQISV